jgi:hypothetical protein
MKSKKEKTPMEKLTQGYEKFIKGKELSKNGKSVFDKVIKKASKPRVAK